jgi:hypothetical protein
MVLLVGAGLFAKSEQRNLHADPGYLPQKVVVSQLRFPENTSLPAARIRLDAIAQRVKALPGVHSVAFSDELPMIFRATVELRPPQRTDAVQAVDVYTGSAGFSLTTVPAPPSSVCLRISIPSASAAPSTRRSTSCAEPIPAATS